MLRLECRKTEREDFSEDKERVSVPMGLPVTVLPLSSSGRFVVISERESVAVPEVEWPPPVRSERESAAVPEEERPSPVEKVFREKGTQIEEE